MFRKFSQVGLPRGVIARAASAKVKPSATAATAAATTATANRVTPTQRDLVHNIMAAENFYNPTVLESEVNSFFELLDLPMMYYLTFSPQQIANHVHAMIAAKEIAASAGREELEFNVEGRDHAMFVCSMAPESMLRAEALVGKYIQSTPSESSCSVFSFHTKAQNVCGKSSMSMLYIATRDKFLCSREAAARTNDISDLATKEFLSNRTAETRTMYEEVLNYMGTVHIPIYHKFSTTPEETSFTVGIPSDGSVKERNILQSITALSQLYGLCFDKKIVESFANGIIVFTYYGQGGVSAETLEKFLSDLEQLLFSPPKLERMFSTLDVKFDPNAMLYMHQAAIFADYFVSQHSDEYAALLLETAAHPRANFHLRTFQKKLIQESVTYNRILETIRTYPAIALALYNDFHDKMASGKGVGVANNDLLEKIRKQVLNPLDLEILTKISNFNSSVMATNFFTSNKASVALQLDGKFIRETPFASSTTDIHSIYQVTGVGFLGFLTQRHPISRGGLNILCPTTYVEEERFKSELYLHNDFLSKLMQVKNKDIPESGSGATMLINHNSISRRKELAQQFMNSIITLLMTGSPKYVFIGPGKNSADLMDDMTELARTRGYPHANAFATGKTPALGGINHDRYKMSTTGRHEFELGVYQRMNLNAANLTKIITGGPDNEQALQEIEMSEEKIIAIVDKHGVLYDPNGLDKAMLLKLGADGRTIMSYDMTRASKGSFRVSRKQDNFADPFGTEASMSGNIYCSQFLKHPSVKADVLILCEEVTEPMSQSAVEGFVVNGQPKFRILFEGTNMAFTEDTRSEIERRGIVLFKDAVVNKGGVMCSSFEVLAALAFTPDEFAMNMCHKGDQPPTFYSEYMNDILAEIRETSRLDLDLIWKSHADAKGTKTRSHIINEISKKVTKLELHLLEQDVWNQYSAVRDRVLARCLPKTLVAKVGLQNVMSRVPKEYLQAYFVMEIACQYTYKYGLAQDEFAFYEFMRTLE
eukprot:PhM_4_TR512/c0_g1_i1/m.66411/K15371/GDH2; glutamate dehydrogenase